jgi:hypothetical protein
MVEQVVVVVHQLHLEQLPQAAVDPEYTTQEMELLVVLVVAQHQITVE